MDAVQHTASDFDNRDRTEALDAISIASGLLAQIRTRLLDDARTDQERLAIRRHTESAADHLRKLAAVAASGK